MRHSKRWETNYKLLLQYYDRHENVLVPSDHVEFTQNNEQVNLGGWISYMRTRYRQGKLPNEKISMLEAIPTWTWGPIRPGPKSKDAILIRDSVILAEYTNGKSLSQIAKLHNLSRQRIHQIIKGDKNAKQQPQLG